MAKRQVEITAVEHQKEVANKTLEAIDFIGKRTANQIRETAAAHLKAAQELADRLNTLANAVELHTATAATDIAAFCTHSTHVLETVQGLHIRLEDVVEAAPQSVPTKLPPTAPLGNGSSQN